jgi:capsid protein
MKIKDFFKRKQLYIEPELSHAELLSTSTIQEQKEATYYGQEYLIRDKLYDAEKTTGELGSPVRYEILHESLSVRAWQLYIESDLAKLIILQSSKWVVGNGLIYQADPYKDIIEQKGYKIDNKKFNTLLEQKIRLWFNDKRSTHNQSMNFHQLVNQIYEHGKVGGDCLVIFRVENGGVTGELVDGANVRTPFGTSYIEEAEKRGNRIIHGVEIDKSNTHIAYYVLITDTDYIGKGQYKRVLCKGEKTGRTQAVMYYGSRYRIGDVRGLPSYASSIQKLKTLDGYVEALATATFERAKVVFFTESNHFSDGTNPFNVGVEQAITGSEDTPYQEVNFDETNKRIYKTTGKQIVNLPTGTTLKALESTIEMRLGDFLKENMIYTTAANGIPYEVATMLYTNSFSASRMATLSFQHFLDVERYNLKEATYKPVVNIMLELLITSGEIEAPGYFNEGIIKDNFYFKAAYHNCRFIGKQVPSADVGKDVKASILAINGGLSTHEHEAELLGKGDATTILEKLGKERELKEKYLPGLEEFNPESPKAKNPVEPK